MLLVECNVLEKVKVINEGTNGGPTRLRLQGKFQQCDEQNNNGRIYPKTILENQVKAIQEKIGDRSLVGALDHPSNDAIHLSQASHLITKLWLEKDGSVMGECEILSTPNGKIVEALINDGVKIGISSRGVGSVSESIKGKVVNEDFKLITFDLVSDPSTRGAFPELTESIRENSQRAQEIVSKHKSERVLVTAFEQFINEAVEKKKASKKATKKLDPVGQEDGDIDNDGDQDETDGYLKNRRAAVKLAIMGKMKGKSKPERSSTEIFGDAIIEAYNEIVRKDEAQGQFEGPERGQGETPSAYRNRMRKMQAGQPGTSRPSGAGVNVTPSIPGVPKPKIPGIRR
jgi:hypothetical protein